MPMKATLGLQISPTDQQCNEQSFPVISIIRFHNVTSGIPEEIVSGKTNDNDKDV